MLRGEESEVLYEHVSNGLLETCRRTNPAGFVSGFAPPGDIREVYKPDEQIAASLHVNGADLRRNNSRVRRVYDLPALPSKHALTC